MSSVVTGNEIRDRILRIFARTPHMRFNEIARALGLRTNHLAYHLRTLNAQGLLRTRGRSYGLSAKGLRVLPALIGPTGPDVPLVVVLVAVTRASGHTLLVHREEQPHKGLWSMPGGRLRLDERPSEAAERIVHAKTGITVVAGSCEGIGHEILVADDGTAHAFLLLMIRAKVRGDGQVKRGARWVRRLPKAMIPSDRAMLLQPRRVHMQEFTKRI